jgi:nucleotide-binding universal stress UspA family protein
VNGWVERIVVALDAASENRIAIAAAARLAARWKTRLHGVFLEDHDLLRLAHLPFARQVTLGFGVEALNLQQAERQLHAFAERARQELAAAAGAHGIEWSFEILPGAAGETVTAADGDLVVAGATTRPIGGYFRVECRWWSVVEPGSVSFLLARREPYRCAAVVALVHDTKPATERLLSVAARFAEAHDARLVALCAPGLADAPQFRAWLDERLAGHSVTIEFETAPAEPAALLRRIAELDCGVVALAADVAEAGAARLRELLAKLAGDLLVVR